MKLIQLSAYALGAVAVFAPSLVFAQNGVFSGQLWPTECLCTGKVPGFGCIILLIHNVMNLAIALGASAAVFAFLWAGFLFIRNAFEPKAENTSKGWDLMRRALIGICIVLAAYPLIDFGLKALYNEGAWESIGIPNREWNALLEPANDTYLCIGPREGPPSNGDTTPDNTDDTPDDNDADDNTPTGEPGTQRYDPGVKAQRDAGHAAPALETFMTCMTGELPENLNTISSISHNSLVGNPAEHTWNECRAARVCQHAPASANSTASCHFGGSAACGNKSFAVDYGDGGRDRSDAVNNTIRDAARECKGSGVLYAIEGNHIHFRVSGCNCDSDYGTPL